MFSEERESVFNGNGGPWSGASLRGGLGQGQRRAAQPKAFHEADDRSRVGVQHWRAALALHHRMAEKKDVSGWGRLFKLCGFESQDCARRRVFALGIEAVRILNLLRVERKREHRLSSNDGARRQRKKRNTVAAYEGIGASSKNGNVVLKILCDHTDLQQLGRGVGTIHENVRLAAVAKRFQDVRDSKQIALFINEEGVAEERVVVTASGGSLIVGVNDRTERGGCRIVRGFSLRGCGERCQRDKSAAKSSKRCERS